MKPLLPLLISGHVVHGFGRGSKALGTPTANFEQSVVDKLPEELEKGIYYGWAQVDGGVVHKACLSLGFNPYFGNKGKSMETHIIHSFDKDFYGSILKLCVAGYIRDERDFGDLDALKTAIKNDIETSIRELDKPEMIVLKEKHFILGNNGGMDEEKGR